MVSLLATEALAGTERQQQFNTSVGRELCYLENPSCSPAPGNFQRLKGAPRPGEPTLQQDLLLGDSQVRLFALE